MPKLNRPLVYLFDGDGPLLNSAEPALAALNQVLESFDLKPLDIDTWRERQNPNLKRFYESLGVPANDVNEAINRYRAYFDGMKFMVTEPAEVTSALKLLRSRRIGVVTSMSRKSWEGYSRRFGFDDFIGVAVTRDDCDEQKPSPVPLYVAMEKLGIQKKKVRAHEVRGIMVGDSVTDIVAGHAAGLETAAIVYEGSYSNRERLLAKQPTYLIPHIGVVANRMALRGSRQHYEKNNTA
ncbi:MAG: HAD hydrolase-like protein [Candidatus Aenigmarchaeota archaeon]|nr:HAD hydrolase-like protein [Candidatus Aenigmarchaeota archaeon]